MYIEYVCFMCAYVCFMYASSYKRDISHIITGCAQHCCKGDQLFQWETPKFDPPPVYPKRLNFSKPKFAQMIMFGISPDVQNVVKIRLWEASPRIGEI